MKSDNHNRKLPHGKQIIIFQILLALMIFPIIGGVGIYLLIGINDILMIVAGCFLILFAILLITFFSCWIPYLFRIEFDENSLIYHYSEIGYLFHKRKVDYSSFIELKALSVEKKNLVLIYMDKQKTIDLSSFSEKQIIKIKAEILMRACKLNGCAVNQI